MEIILKKNRNFTFLVLLLLFISCDSKIEFTKYKLVPDSSWESHKNISFEFEVLDTILPKNLFINIRNNKEYEYSNLYLITELVFPNNDKIIDTLQYEMADKLGQFLGKGFTEIKENKLFYKEKKIFPVSGNYTFNIRHAMRKNGQINAVPFLEGVQDVGFSIEKSE